LDYSLLLIIGGTGAIAFYMAWSIGANDVANSMATAVGAKAITFKQAVLIAGVLNLVGAVFVGSHVTDTVRKGIVDVTGIEPHILLLGFVSSLLAAAIWVTVSTWREMPIGLIAGGTSSIIWEKVGAVAASWIISPISGCILAFIVFKIIVKLIFSKEKPVKSAKIVGPVIIGFTAFLIVSSIFLKTSLSERLGISDIESLLIASFVSIIIGIIGILLKLCCICTRSK